VLAAIAPALHALADAVPVSTRGGVAGAPAALFYLMLCTWRLWRAR
jgi:hypothetical protein